MTPQWVGIIRQHARLAPGIAYLRIGLGWLIALSNLGMLIVVLGGSRWFHPNFMEFSMLLLYPLAIVMNFPPLPWQLYEPLVLFSPALNILLGLGIRAGSPLARRLAMIFYLLNASALAFILGVGSRSAHDILGLIMMLFPYGVVLALLWILPHGRHATDMPQPILHFK